MRPRFSLARGLTVAAALLSISAAALGAPKRKARTPKKAPTAEAAPATVEPEAPKAEAPPVEEKPAEPVKLAEEEPPAPPPEKLALKAEIPPNSEPREATDSGDEALGRSERKRVAAGRIEVAVSVSVEVGMRRFKYSDPVGPLPAAYRLPIAPMASFGLEAYPLASSNLPFLRDFGFRGRFSRAFAVDSNTPEGVTIETNWTRFAGELRERVLVPGSHPLELGVFVGADASYFNMKTETPVAALLPSARTIAARVGLDARVLLGGRFSFMVGAAYLAVTSRGEIYERFRSPSVSGLDGDLGFALGLLPGLEARATGRYTRYFSTFKPAIGDQIVAGGALDEQMQFGLGVRYAH